MTPDEACADQMRRVQSPGCPVAIVHGLRVASSDTEVPKDSTITLDEYRARLSS